MLYGVSLGLNKLQRLTNFIMKFVWIERGKNILNTLITHKHLHYHQPPPPPHTHIFCSCIPHTKYPYHSQAFALPPAPPPPPPTHTHTHTRFCPGIPPVAELMCDYHVYKWGLDFFFFFWFRPSPQAVFRTAPIYIKVPVMNYTLV